MTMMMMTMDILLIIKNIIINYVLFDNPDDIYDKVTLLKLPNKNKI